MTPPKPLGLIQVDDRIGSVEVFKHFRAGTAKITRLEFADFAFMGHGPNGPTPVGIERKRVTDLVNSMQSGRLAEHQLPGLREYYDQIWVIVEGRYKANPKTGILQTYSKRVSSLGLAVGKSRSVARDLVCGGGPPVTESAVDSFIASLVTQGGVHVMKTDDPAGTARFVQHLWQWWSKEWEGHTSLNALHELQLRKSASPVERVAAQIPGLGYKRAKAVAAHFGTVAQMVGAGVKEWAEIEGIGKIVAKGAVEFLHG